MYLLFDIGGTKCRYALSRDGETIEKSVVIPTPPSYEEILLKFKEIQESLPPGELQSIAAGLAGPLDSARSMLVNSPHTPALIGKPFKRDVENIFKVPVSLENDAVAAGVGEAVQGAGKGKSIVVYMTVSTGVGGARIIDGRVDRSAMGFEPGHQIIDQGKSLELEQLVSGSGVAARYGKDPRKIADKTIWDELARLLAVGLNNTILHWSPDIVVLGGSMILGDPAISLDMTRKYLKDILTIFPELPPVVKAELGDAAGLYGALELAKQHV
ncbi:ROK family protein [Patescibacteria group bacterium]|nr:ROK family protein [Patescibacteria group bacterium]